MTTTRIVRGTKARVLLYVCAVLFVTGLIACYNNVRVQLDDLRKTHELCRQEQENLSNQLQVIYEYKQRLEKSLKTEKGDHQRTKTELQTKFNEDRLQNEKINSDARLQFSSLQQHYKLLETQHSDFKEKCSQKQKEQLDEINKLQAKLTEIQEQMKQSDHNNGNEMQHLKTQYDLLKNENEKVHKELEMLKAAGSPTLSVKRTEHTSTHFSRMVPVEDNHYLFPELEKQQQENQQLPQPQEEQFNNLPEDVKNVLAMPSNLVPSKSSTINNLVSKPDLVGAVPLKSPTVTPETPKRSTSKEMSGNNKDVLPLPYAVKVPKGVVPPAQDQLLEETPVKQISEDNNIVVNNRYRGNIIDAEGVNNKNEVLVDENAANEVDIPNNVKIDGDSKVRKHIDELALEEKGDGDYDAGHLMDEGEDDDAVDGNPAEQEPPAIRN